MEEVKKNITTFLEILKIGRTESVTHWDESNFKRAQQWARYVEEVYKKVKNKTSLVKELTDYVNQKFREDDVNRKFVFSSLECATGTLRVILLQNIHLSSAQFSLVLEMYGVDFLSSSKTNFECLMCDTFRISRHKGFFSILSTIKDELSSDFERSQKISVNDGQFQNHSGEILLSSGSSNISRTTDISLDACAKLLWRCLRNMDKHKDNESDCYFVKKLTSITCQRKGIEILLRMLLTPLEGERTAAVCDDDIVLDPLKHQVLSWFLQDSNRCCTIMNYNDEVWSCPSTLLCGVSFLNIPFCKSYLNFLKSVGDNLVGRSSLVISYENTSFGSSVRDLVQRFQELQQGPEHISEICQQTLRSWFEDSDCVTDIDEVSVNLWRRIYQQIFL